ncbi:MAG: RdgB/HAM1 family non-canonical purine NTP pyrophosphatase [Chlorobiales bacterium]|nr:RdgB/HAM1 family non-canonical purine NTP pyrophosphatase [Chlorobiales bacterium]
MPATHDNTITIILATSNQDKVKELRPLLENISHLFKVTTLKELGIEVEIEETEQTLEGNALLKAKAIFSLLSERFPYMIALADDTGLEVDSLHGAPGVYSARYAPKTEGSPTYDENVCHLLHSMNGITDRKARFRTVIALKGSLPFRYECFQFEHTAEGIVSGSITLEPKGEKGFGYDPVFLVNSTGKTYAEMSTAEKNTLSHRALALQKAITDLKNILKQTSTAQ